MSNYPDFDKTDTQCQPCGNFTPEEGYYGAEHHSCPHCEGTRINCQNCRGDHHSGGWNTCGDPRIETCKHPACVARLRNQTPNPAACGGSE